MTKDLVVRGGLENGKGYVLDRDADCSCFVGSNR